MRVQIPANGWRPRPYQMAAWEYLQGGGKHAELVYHRRCLARGTHITMADGSWKRIEDIAPGDEIMTWAGGEYVTDRVKNSWCAGVKPVMRISAAGFPDILATEDHRFFHHRQTSPVGWREIGAFSTKKTGEESKEKGSVDKVAIISGENRGSMSAKEKAEFFGYMITDGSINADQQPKFTNTERILCDRVALLAEKFGASPRFREKGNGWDVGLSNGRRGGGEIENPIKAMAQREGALAKRSERRAPKFLWDGDNETLAAFFGAVIDGDGSLWLHRPKVAFKGGHHVDTAAEIKIHAGESEDLAWDYYWLLRKLGIAASRVCHEKKSCWTVRIWRRDAVLDLLALIEKHIRHPAKSVRAHEIMARVKHVARKKHRGVWLAGISREDAGTAETWDIEIERHHSFFANGYLVHNSGKDEVCLHWAAVSAIRHPATYWHMLPQAAQARKAIWEAVNPHSGKRRIDEAFPHSIRSNTRENEMLIKFVNGATWQVVGSDNYDALVGSPPYGVVFSEWALAKPEARAMLRPILMENGGWQVYITTPRGPNHAKDTFESAMDHPGSFAQLLDATQTGVFTPEQLESERRQYILDYGQDVGEAKFEQEYMCSWAAVITGHMVFDRAALKAARREAYQPISRAEVIGGKVEKRENGCLRIWCEPESGQKYVIGADVSEGVEHGDYSSADILRASDGAQVAQWHGKIAPDLYAGVLAAIGKKYNEALIGVEKNNHGLTTLIALRNGGYKRMYYQARIDRQVKDEISDQLGWLTTAKSKPVIIDRLAVVVRDTPHLIASRDTLDEMSSYIVQEDGSYGASPGNHDDRVMSLAIAHEMRSAAGKQRGNIPASSTYRPADVVGGY